MAFYSPRKIIIKLTIAVVLIVFVFIAAVYFLTRELVIKPALLTEEKISQSEELDLPPPFPTGVDLKAESITEYPDLDIYIESNLSFDQNNSRKDQFFDRLLAKLVQWDWYQNLASSVSRILVIYSGERQEEIVKNFTDILKWNEEESELFYLYISEAEPTLSEGKFYPGRYVVPYDATPEMVADLLYERFEKEVLERYTIEVIEKVPLNTALTVASLLEREAYDFVDMRYISGIIWNRLFIDMPLQLDATLQYARGSQSYEAKWWPKVVPKDKFIESPYNTYENTGLPPGPIANPSVESIIAALNPRQTNCMFYFHDAKGKFYCTETYAEHVAKLKEVYGRGS